MDKINEQISVEIKKFCLELETKFQISHTKLFQVWLTPIEKKEDGRYNDKLDCNIVKIENISFLICSEGVFGKIHNDDVLLMTEDDQNLCFKNGYKTMKGLINDVPIQ